MSKRKFSKKEVAISIAAAALAIATVGGAVAIHKDSSNSNTGHSITVEQSDYSKKKEEAIQQIEDAVKDLSDDQQSEIDSYIKQNIENIQKAESERTIESTLQETLDYIDQRSLSEKEEQRKETQTTETSSSSEREVTSSSVSEEDKYHILAVMLFLQSISQLQTMYKGDGWKVFMDSCAVFLFLGSGRGAYDTQETISKMLGAATIEKASGSVSYGQNGSSSTSYDRLQRSLMDANEVAQMDKDSCIILPFASKPIIDKKYKPFHDPSYLKAKKYGPYTHPVEIFRDKNGNLHTVNHQEKFYFPDEGLQAKIRDDLKEGKSSGMLFELSEDEFCSLDLDDPKLNGPQGNLFLLQQLKKLEDDSATLKLQNAVNEKMNSVIYDTSDNTSSLEADEESAAETISVYDVRQSWDLSGNLEDVIRRYILELSEDEVSNITEAMNRHIPEKKIKDCLTLPPEKLCLMLQFYMKQAN